MLSFDFIARALTLYEEHGYKRIEVPWWVTSDIANITKPPHVPESSNYTLSVNGKCLLASGEQAFLSLANKGYLAPGKYQTVTPCFRNEEYDRYHSKQFLKLELINLLTEDERVVQEHVQGIALHAIEVFRSFAGSYSRYLEITKAPVDDPCAVPGTEQLDIVMKLGKQEVELGSYGARCTSFATWIYGTGLAEPRFSKTLREVMTFSPCYG